MSVGHGSFSLKHNWVAYYSLSELRNTFVDFLLPGFISLRRSKLGPNRLALSILQIYVIELHQN